MKPRNTFARVLLVGLTLAAATAGMSAGGCAMRPAPGETQEDFETRRDESRQRAGEAIDGLSDTVATVIPGPVGMVGGALLGAIGLYLGHRRSTRRPAPAATSVTIAPADPAR